MLAIERKNEILDKLRAEQRVLVSDLAAYYHVTEETIRRDLDKLEKEGYARSSATARRQTCPIPSGTRPTWKRKIRSQPLPAAS